MTRIGIALDPEAQRRRIARDQRRRRLRPWGEGLIGFLALAILATGVWAQNANQSTPVDPAALFAEEFGDDASTDAVASTPATSTGTTADVGEASAPSAPSATADVEQAATPEGEPPATDATDASTASEPAGAPEPTGTQEPAPAGEPAAAPATPTLALPAEGLYTYETTGYESLSLAGARHDYPEESYIVLRHRGGCEYTLDHRILEEKEGKNTYCHTGPEMRRVRYDGAVTFFGQSEESHYTCDGVIMDLRDQIGAVHNSTCTSDDGNGETRETVEFVSIETMVIGGVEVEAWHYHQESVISGDVTGTGTADYWFRPSDGLLLRWERQNQSFANAFGGDVEYNEEATFLLTSLTPQR